MSDYYTESQVNRIEEDAYNGAMLEAGKEWERQRDEFNSREHELEARIAELETAQRWIPVSERLPEKDVRVVIRKGNRYAVGWWESVDDIYDWVCWDDMWNGDTPTHWMPLPARPEVQE